MGRPDPRGPLVKIVEVAALCDGNHYLMECGHHSGSPPHFTCADVGELRRCYQCGREATLAYDKAEAHAR